MPLELSQNRGPIDETDRTFFDVLDDLQGNILAGHGRLHAAHLFVHFRGDCVDAAKAWIRGFASTRITSALAQARASDAFRTSGADAGGFAHFALSAAGYRALGIPDALVPQGTDPRNRRDLPVRPGRVPPDEAVGAYSNVFSGGMGARRPFLLDPPVDALDPEYRGEGGAIHAMILLADDDPAELVAAERVVLTQLAAFADIVASERGMNLKKQFHPQDGPDGLSIEHFGYVDGRSQPLFLLRHVRREDPVGGGSFWDPRAPLSLVLVPDPNGTPNVSFGSFLVYRKLEQNVKGFKAAEKALAAELGLPTELVGAMAVGRYEDGTPIVLQPSDGTRPIPNDFNYGGDPAGRSCPFHAHIRKTNPRLESARLGGPFAQSEAEELGHRIARRGIPYGGPQSEGDDLPTRGVGLLFFCYQSDIWEQFEFMQRFWANNPTFLEPQMGGPGAPGFSPTGLDAVIGQRIPGSSDPIGVPEPFPPKNWPREWGKPTQPVDVGFAGFVNLRGGEYLFCPSINFLRSLD